MRGGWTQRGRLLPKVSAATALCYGDRQTPITGVPERRERARTPWVDRTAEEARDRVARADRKSQPRCTRRVLAEATKNVRAAAMSRSLRGNTAAAMRRAADRGPSQRQGPRSRSSSHAIERDRAPTQFRNIGKVRPSRLWGDTGGPSWCSRASAALTPGGEDPSATVSTATTRPARGAATVGCGIVDRARCRARLGGYQR